MKGSLTESLSDFPPESTRAFDSERLANRTAKGNEIFGRLPSERTRRANARAKVFPNCFEYTWARRGRVFSSRSAPCI